MIPFLSTYLFFFLGFSSIIQTQQNQLYFEKYDVKSGLVKSCITITAKTHSNELKVQTLRTKEAGKEFDSLPTKRAGTNLIITLPV